MTGKESIVVILILVGMFSGGLLVGMSFDYNLCDAENRIKEKSPMPKIEFTIEGQINTEDFECFNVSSTTARYKIDNQTINITTELSINGHTAYFCCDHAGNCGYSDEILKFKLDEGES